VSEVQQRLAKYTELVDGAVSAAKGDGGASPALVAVVEELSRKFRKALGTMDQGGSEREAVVEVEQAADSAKYAAEADPGVQDATKQAIVEAHDKICVLKSKMDQG
jgi:NADPH-dependent ferric siderophore reductase